MIKITSCTFLKTWAEREERECVDFLPPPPHSSKLLPTPPKSSPLCSPTNPPTVPGWLPEQTPEGTPRKTLERAHKREHYI